MTLHLEYMYQDPPCRPGEIPPALEGLSILSGGGDAHIYGKVMTPGRPPGERRPCAILLHGYPGYTSLFDIGQGLRRMGAVAVSISYRGCWGSEGQYTLSGIIEDAVAAAEWARTTETASKYGIDTDNKPLQELLAHNTYLLEKKDDDSVQLLIKQGWPLDA